MRYNNITYLIPSKNLNNSLVFYRALFDRMPDIMNEVSMTFIHSEFSLEIREGQLSSRADELLIYRMEEGAELEKVNDRMRRFRSLEQLNNNCEVLGKTIGLVDPSGNKWIIGNPNNEVQFNKCYINFKS